MLYQKTNDWLASTLRSLSTRALQIWKSSLPPPLNPQTFQNDLVTIYNSLTTKLETLYDTFLCLSAVRGHERQSYTNKDPHDTAVSRDPRLSSVEAIAADFARLRGQLKNCWKRDAPPSQHTNNTCSDKKSINPTPITQIYNNIPRPCLPVTP